MLYIRLLFSRKTFAIINSAGIISERTKIVADSFDLLDNKRVINAMMKKNITFKAKLINTKSPMLLLKEQNSKLLIAYKGMENPSTEKNALKQIKSIVQNHKATENTKVSDAKSFARISGYPPICDV